MTRSVYFESSYHAAADKRVQSFEIFAHESEQIAQELVETLTALHAPSRCPEIQESCSGYLNGVER
jgi:hypothetical protein